MAKSDDLLLTIKVDGKPVYFNAPVFYSTRRDSGDGLTLVIETQIGSQTKQKIEIALKNPTYVEPIITTEGDSSLHSDTKPDRPKRKKV